MNSITGEFKSWTVACPKCKKEFVISDIIEGNHNEGEICYCVFCGSEL